MNDVVQTAGAFLVADIISNVKGNDIVMLENASHFDSENKLKANDFFY